VTYGTIYGMVKTTIYLPEELKAAVALKALSEHASEADIIRQALEEATRQHSASARMPRIPEWDGDGGIASRVDEVLAAGFGGR
jgi:ribbon-helix-helix CopG family protein